MPDLDQELEERYNQLPNSIKTEHAKEKLLRRLAKIDTSRPVGRHGPLCLRKPTCSPDCRGGDC